MQWSTNRSQSSGSGVVDPSSQRAGDLTSGGIMVVASDVMKTSDSVGSGYKASQSNEKYLSRGSMISKYNQIKLNLITGNTYDFCHYIEVDFG